jgi:DNA-binding MarR family transcriptional regulator
MSIIENHRKNVLPTGKELAVLHAISEAEQQLGCAPHLGDVAEKYGVTRQAIHYWVKRLRLKNLVEEGPGAGHTLGSKTPPILLTQQGRYFIATSR